MGRFNLNDYEPVEARIRRFKQNWPDSDILTELVEVAGEIGQSRWTVKASVWREKGYDRPDSTGYAFEVDGTGMANNTSALENCETSAIGRALANLNYHGNLRVTREEMAKVERAEQRTEYVKTQSQKMLEAEKAGDIEVLRKALDYYSKQNDRELALIASNIVKRMQKAAEQVVEDVLGGEVVDGGD